MSPSPGSVVLFNTRLALKGTEEKQKKRENISISIVLGAQNQTFAWCHVYQWKECGGAAGCPLLQLPVSI